MKEKIDIEEYLERIKEHKNIDRNIYERTFKWNKENSNKLKKLLNDLTNINLTGADLTNTNLSYANLTGADLTNANLTNINLERAILKNTKFWGD